MVNANSESQRRYAEELRRELDLKRKCAAGDVEARRELARLEDEARQHRATERERRRQSEYDRLGFNRG